MNWIVATVTFAALIFGAHAQANEVFRWVDENGVVHYSDQEREGAERIRIRPAQSYESTLEARPRGVDPQADDDAAESALAYTMIRITSPPDGEAIWATGGVFTIQVETVPALQRGHRLSLTLNGEEVSGTPAGTTQIGLTGLTRGTHTLQAAVVDEAGQMQIFSQEITFNVLQASVNQPQRRRSAP